MRDFKSILRVLLLDEKMDAAQAFRIAERFESLDAVTPTAEATPAAEPTVDTVAAPSQGVLIPVVVATFGKQNTARGAVRASLIDGPKTPGQIAQDLASGGYSGKGRRAINDLLGRGQARKVSRGRIELTDAGRAIAEGQVKP